MFSLHKAKSFLEILQHIFSLLNSQKVSSQRSLCRFLPWNVSQLQFPIKIAYCLTINRAQGQSASKCGILLPKDVSTHGQIYVAFSRCGNPNNIYVWAEQSQFETYNLSKQKTYVKNVVYDEVIKDITSE